MPITPHSCSKVLSMHGMAPVLGEPPLQLSTIPMQWVTPTPFLHLKHSEMQRCERFAVKTFIFSSMNQKLLKILCLGGPEIMFSRGMSTDKQEPTWQSHMKAVLCCYPTRATKRQRTKRKVKSNARRIVLDRTPFDPQLSQSEDESPT